MNLFAYGTLMVPRLMAAITGREFVSSDAVLEGYARYGVKNAPYPGLVSECGACTSGTVYFDLDAQSLHLLDRFEGNYYQRVQVDVGIPQGEVARAETYVFKPEFRHLLSDSEWDVEGFRQVHLERYIRSVAR